MKKESIITLIFQQRGIDMEIKRDKYLQALIDRMHNGLVKVITGIRRSGKSYLVFRLFKTYLLSQGIEQNHIIEIQFDRRENVKYRNPDFALDYIKQLLLDDGRYYILLDEVQLLASFEDVLNSLLYIPNVDLYVTGSNSKFLSRDIITEFRGRGDEVHVYPLSFKEFFSVYQRDVYQAWADYVTYGGLPLTAIMKNDEQKIAYLTKLFQETYIKDITERHRIEKLQELNDIINILASAIGSLTNPSKIKATFKSKMASDISLNTIIRYIENLKDAFLINEAHRYDVKGRKYIGTPLKYYFEDIGLRNARLGFRQVEENRIMENIIYNELKMRGYQVDVGMVTKRLRNDDGKMQKKQLEIDFIANLGSKRYYIQSAFNMPSEEKIKQEKASLISVNDSFKKIIIVKDVIKVKRDDYGIVTISIYDFLLNENSLEF